MTVGAVGAIVGARAARQRHNARGRTASGTISAAEMKNMRTEVAEWRELRDIMMKYDANNSGKLEKEEMYKLLMDYDSQFSSKLCTPPSEDEVNLIMALADRKCVDGCINLSELKTALQEWKGYTKMREPLEAALHDFDRSGTGKLEPAELKEYLKSMNGNKKVSDSDVDWVLSRSDISGDGACSSSSELYLATKSWSQHKKEQGQCCVVM